MKKGSFDFINLGHVLGRSEMKKLMAGSGDCSGCEDCLGAGCDKSSGTYCGMIQDTRDGSYHKCYRN